MGIALLIFLHVLAATVWTGGHLVLALTVLPRALRQSDPAFIHRFEAGYERIGVPALLIQALTGFALAFHSRPAPGAWFSSADPVGMLIGIKVVLLLLTLALALHARLRVLPELDASRLRALAWHIVPVTVLAVLFVLAGVGIRTGGFAG